MLQEVTKERIIPRVTGDHEKMHNDAPVEFTEAQLGIGEAVDQGDVIVVRIPRLPAKAKVRANRQVAEGDTQGSRHVLSTGNIYDCDPDSVVELIRQANGANINPTYIGPVFQTANGQAELTHPEHGNHVYKGEMTCAVVIQRNWDAEEQAERRARD
jgi:hypothetical protein